jgi:hypothetical protein
MKPFKHVVGVCIPSGDTWKAQMAVCFSGLAMYSSLRETGIALFNTHCSQITTARNDCVKSALLSDPKVTHILWIDSDQTFPPDALQRLLAHDKDIVSPFIVQRRPPYTLLGCLKKEPNAPTGLHEASLLPHGFALVKRHVYETIKGPFWYRETYDPAFKGEDVNFWDACREAGFTLWCDLDMTYEIGHIGETIAKCPDLRKKNAPQHGAKDIFNR